MFEDMMISGEGLNDPSITKIVCEEALDAYEWLKNVLGVHYQTRVEVFGGHRVPRCYSPDSLSGSTMIQKMKQKCVELGILIYCGVCVESIIIDEHYRVCGVNADANFSLDPAHPKKSVHYWASKGIIVYSGGFAADLRFKKKHEAKVDESTLTTNKLTSSVELLAACMTIGSATAHLVRLQ